MLFKLRTTFNESASQSPINELQATESPRAHNKTLVRSQLIKELM